MKLLFIIYVDWEYLLEKLNICYNNVEMSSTTKINKHKTSGYSLLTHCSFNVTKNRLHYYRRKECVKNFCKDLKEHAIKIINYEKKEMIPLTIEESQSYHEQNICYICKKESSIDNKDKKYEKARDHCHYTGKYRGAAHNICNLSTKHQNKFLLYFIMVPHTTIISQLQS